MANRQALLIVDRLNDFVRPGAPLEVAQARIILPALQQRLHRARGARIPVVFVCDRHLPDDPEFSRMGWPPHAVTDTAGAAVVAELYPLPDESVVCKTAYSGFFGSGLDALLERLEVSSLVLTGCVTNICILYTAADAVMRGYEVVVPQDCVAAIDPQAHAFALAQMREVLGVTLIGQTL